MHITDIMQGNSPTFSFEFFPPKTPEAAETLYQTIRELESYMPHFVSVTYGAGGSTRDLTHDLVERIQHTTKLDPIPHLTCVCHNEQEVEAILTRYARSAIGNILALGGDRPPEIPYDKSRDSFKHAVDLVKFIRRFNESGVHPDPRGFGIGVAGFPEGHPATPNRLVEMDHLKAKVDAGADYIVTQLFFENRDFLDFRERCALANIHVPIRRYYANYVHERTEADRGVGRRCPFSGQTFARYTAVRKRCRNDQACRRSLRLGTVSRSLGQPRCRTSFLYSQSF